MQFSSIFYGAFDTLTATPTRLVLFALLECFLRSSWFTAREGISLAVIAFLLPMNYRAIKNASICKCKMPQLKQDRLVPNSRRQPTKRIAWPNVYTTLYVPSRRAACCRAEIAWTRHPCAGDVLEGG